MNVPAAENERLFFAAQESSAMFVVGMMTPMPVITQTNLILMD